jgi:hypothetical protein
VASIQDTLKAGQHEIARRQEQARQQLLTEARALAQEHGLDLATFLRLPRTKRRTKHAAVPPLSRPTHQGDLPPMDGGYS